MVLFRATTTKQVTRQVIFEGAQVNAVDEQGDTALHSALRRRAPLDVVVELVRLGAAVNAKGWQFHTPLVLAIYHPDVRVMEHLIASGALVDGGPMHSAPLHAAVHNDCFDRVERLLAHGADPNRRGYRGKTPLFAARSGAMVDRLIQAGANPYLRDMDGESAIERWNQHCPPDALRVMCYTKPPKPVLRLVGDSSEHTG